MVCYMMDCYMMACYMMVCYMIVLHDGAGLSGSVTKIDSVAVTSVQARGEALALKHTPYSGWVQALFKNYLEIAGIGIELLDENIELHGSDLPHASVDSQVLVLAFVACIYLCPIKHCGHKVKQKPGLMKQWLEPGWTII